MLLMIIRLLIKERKKVVFTFKKMYACILGKFWDMFDNCFEKYFFFFFYLV